MNIRQFFIFFIGAFACLYLAFSSTATVPYVHNDSMRYFDKFYDQKTAWQKDPQYQWLNAMGRPVAARIEGFIYEKINHLSDLSRLRFIAIIVFTLCAALLGNILISLGVETIPSFCISVAVFTLPGNQECIFGPFLFIGLALLLSLSAYAVWIGRSMPVIRFLMAAILLETAFLTYVPSTFFFLVPVSLIIILKNDDWQISKRVFKKGIIFYMLLGFINLFVIKIIYYKNFELLGHAITGGNILNNIKTFLPQDVPQSLNLWNIYYSRVSGIILGLFMTGIFIADALGQKNIMKGQRILAILVVFLIFNTVWFMYGGYLPRTFIAAQTLILFLVYWSGEWIIKKLKSNSKMLVYWPVLIMITGLMWGSITTERNVWNCNAELMFIRSSLAKYADSDTTQIHIIRQKDNTKGYNGFPSIYDNFNSGSAYANEIPELIRVALKDLDDPPTQMHCIVTSSDYGEPFTRVGPRVLVIDMNDLVRVSRDHLR